MKKILFVAMVVSLLVKGYAGECNPCGQWTVGGDWLYWKNFQDNMEYAAFVAQERLLIRSKALAPNFQANHGFRVFAEYEACPQSWYLSANFTRLISHAHNNNSVADFENEFMVIDSLAFPLYTILNDFQAQFFLLESSWATTFNYFDLDFGFPLCTRSCFDIVPHMGLRGLWMRQQFNLSGQGLINDDEPDFIGFFSEFREQFDGYGVEGGIHGSLQLGCGFSFVGHLGGALLYSRINIEEELVSAVVIRSNNEIFHLTPMFDGFIGIEYTGNCYCYPFNLHVGWEQHIIMAATHFGVFSYANTSYQGLTLGGSLSF